MDTNCWSNTAGHAASLEKKVGWRFSSGPFFRIKEVCSEGEPWTPCEMFQIGALFRWTVFKEHLHISVRTDCRYYWMQNHSRCGNLLASVLYIAMAFKIMIHHNPQSDLGCSTWNMLINCKPLFILLISCAAWFFSESNLGPKYITTCYGSGRLNY